MPWRMAEDTKGSVTDHLLVTVIGVVSAGVGSLGLVTAVGGLVTEGRFRSAGLPTEVSVSVQSRDYLLTVGGEVLAVAVLVALMLVGTVCWWRPSGWGRARWSKRCPC